MPLVDAMALLKRRRPQVDPIPPFMGMLQDYENICRQSGAIQSKSSDKKRAIGPSLPPNIKKAKVEDASAPEAEDTSSSKNDLHDL